MCWSVPSDCHVSMFQKTERTRCSKLYRRHLCRKRYVKHIRPNNIRASFCNHWSCTCTSSLDSFYCRFAIRRPFLYIWNDIRGMLYHFIARLFHSLWSHSFVSSWSLSICFRRFLSQFFLLLPIVHVLPCEPWIESLQVH